MILGLLTVYARTENYYLKNYEEERSMTVHILVDSSSSMNYGKPYTKFEFASMIGVGFAYLALKENEKFKFSTFDEHVATFRSSRGRGHLAAMVHYLNSMKPRGKGNFKESMDSYRKYIKGKSVVIIISDFLTDPDIVEKAMVNFAKQEVKVIQVLDRVEKDMLLQGDLRLEDLESNSTMRTYISARLREEYKNRLNDHTAKIRQGCHRFGAHFEQVISDEPIFDAFFRILR